VAQPFQHLSVNVALKHELIDAGTIGLERGGQLLCLGIREFTVEKATDQLLHVIHRVICLCSTLPGCRILG
jgi:hypothetical protein